MGLKRTDELRHDAVRIALTSGLTRREVADDLGVGPTVLTEWCFAFASAGLSFFGLKGYSQRQGL